MVVARLVSASVALMLLSAPVLAQKAVVVDAFRELEAAMLEGDHSRANAAIDAMSAALTAWEGAGGPAGGALLDEEAADRPMLPLAAYADGFARMRRGEYRDAITSLRRAAAIGADERPQLVVAGTLAQQGRDLEAERTLRSIVGAFPESGVAHWWLGRVYEKLNRIADARREYEVAVSAALTGRATLYASIGRLSRAEGDFTRATDALERRLQLTPNSPAAHKELARVYLEQDRTEQALAAFRAAVSIDPRDAEAHAAIGRIRLDAGQPAEAIPALRRALDLAPTLYEARYPLALALRQTGRGDEAARELVLYERARQQATEDRRRTMAEEARRQEAAKQDSR
jgi:tetratricopeptide (TPR) repeat protein